MPKFDQTGPRGQGAMTGRKMGKCSSKKNNSQKKRGEGRCLSDYKENLEK
jgi:hypothetical protein